MTDTTLTALLDHLKTASPQNKGGIRKAIIAHHVQAKDYQRCERFMHEAAQEDRDLPNEGHEFDTHSTEYFIVWAQMLNRLGRDIDAKDKLIKARQNAKESDKANGQLCLELLKELFNTKAYRHCELWAQECMELGHHGSSFYYYLANALRLQHKHLPALEAINRCASKTPTHWDVYWTRAAIHLAMDNFEACLKDCEAVLEQEQGNATTWFRMGLCLEKLGRPQDALDKFRKSTSLDPYLFAAYTAQMELAVQLGQAQQAQAALAQMTEHLEVSETVTQHWGQQIQAL